MTKLTLSLRLVPRSNVGCLYYFQRFYVVSIGKRNNHVVFSLPAISFYILRPLVNTTASLLALAALTGCEDASQSNAPSVESGQIVAMPAPGADGVALASLIQVHFAPESELLQSDDLLKVFEWRSGRRAADLQ